MLPERRYAEWRSVAVRRIPAQWIGLAAGVGLSLALSLLIHRIDYGIVMGGLAIAGFVSNRLVARQMAGLRDEGDDQQFGATLVLSREAAYGFDEGLVSFEEGWVVFTGRRCTFSVGAGDVRVIKRGKSELQFGFEGPGGDHKARFALTSSETFAQASLEWIHAARRSEGAVFPPTRPAPSAPSAGAALVGGATIVGLVVLTAAFLQGDPFDRLSAFGGAFVVFGFALAYAYDLRKVLGRIERGEPAGLPFGSRPLGRKRPPLLPPPDVPR